MVKLQNLNMFWIGLLSTKGLTNTIGLTSRAIPTNILTVIQIKILIAVLIIVLIGIQLILILRIPKVINPNPNMITKDCLLQFKLGNLIICLIQNSTDLKFLTLIEIF